MKRRLLSFVLAFAMLLSVTPVAVFATATAVAKIGNTEYTDLQAALNAGGVVELLKDVAISSKLYINKDVIIDGNGYTITASGTNRLFRINDSEKSGNAANVVFTDIIIKNTTANSRCIETRSGDLSLTLNGVKLYSTGPAYDQTLTVGGSGNNITINIVNSVIKADTHYGIVTFNPVNMTITNSEITGYAALYMKGADSSLGSDGSKVSVIGSTLKGVNNAAYHPSNSFGAVVLEDCDNISISLTNGSSIVAAGNGNNVQYGLATKLGATNIKVDADKTSAVKSELTGGKLVSEDIAVAVAPGNPFMSVGADGSVSRNNYVSLGDSMSNGYGLDGYNSNTGVEDYGYESYANQFASYYGFNHAQLAMSAMRAEDLHWLLEVDYDDPAVVNVIETLAENDDYYRNNIDAFNALWYSVFTNGDYWTWRELVNEYRFDIAAAYIENLDFDCVRNGTKMTGAEKDDIYDHYVRNSDIKALQVVAAYYQNSVRDAKVVSLGIGNGNFGVFAFGRIMEAVGFSGSPENAMIYNIDNALREVGPELRPLVDTLLADAKNVLAQYGIVADDGSAEVTPMEALYNTFMYATISYALNYAGTVEAILQLNPDADIIQVALMNTFVEEQAASAGIFNVGSYTDLTLGDVMDLLFKPLNAYLAALPTAMQAMNNSVYANADFYWAEADYIKCIVDTYEDPITNEIVRDRFVESIVGDSCACYYDRKWHCEDLGCYKIVEGEQEKCSCDNGATYCFRASGMVWGLLAGTAVKVTLDEIEAYEALDDAGKLAYAATDTNKAMSISMYLAFEKAIVAGKNTTVGIGSIMNLGSLLGGNPFGAIMEDFYAAAAVAGATKLDAVCEFMALTAKALLEETINTKVREFLVSKGYTPEQANTVSVSVSVTGTQIKNLVTAANDTEKNAAANVIAQNAVDAVVATLAPIYKDMTISGVAVGVDALMAGINGYVYDLSAVSLNLSVDEYYTALTGEASYDASTDASALVNAFYTDSQNSFSKLKTYIDDKGYTFGITGTFVVGAIQSDETYGPKLNEVVTNAGIIQTDAGIGTAVTALLNSMIPGGDAKAYVAGMLTSQITGEAVNLLCTLLVMPEVLGETVANSNLSGLLALFARCVIGNGIGSHPAEDGHNSMFAAMKNTYENEFTSQDQTINNLDYYYMQAYAKAKESGAIDAAWAAMVAAKGALKTAYTTVNLYPVDAEFADIKTALLNEIAAAEATAAEISDILAADQLGNLRAAYAALIELEDDLWAHVSNMKALSAEIGVVADIYLTLAIEAANHYSAMIDTMVNNAYAWVINGVVEFNAEYLALVDKTGALADQVDPALGAAVRKFMIETPADTLAILYAYGEEAVLNLFIAAVDAADDVYVAATALAAVLKDHGVDIYRAIMNDLTCQQLRQQLIALNDQLLALEAQAKNAPMSTSLALYAQIDAIKAQAMQLAVDFYNAAIAAVAAADPIAAQMLDDAFQAFLKAVGTVGEAADGYAAWLPGHANAMAGDLLAALVANWDEFAGVAGPIVDEIIWQILYNANDYVEGVIDEVENQIRQQLAILEAELLALKSELETAVGEAKAQIQSQIDAIYAKITELKAALAAGITDNVLRIYQLLEEIKNDVITLANAAMNAALTEAHRALSEIAANLAQLDEIIKNTIGNKYTEFKAQIGILATHLLDKLVETAIRVAPEIDTQLYDFFYNNPDKVIAFMEEYSDVIFDIIAEYGDEALGTIGVALFLYGEDLAEYLIENREAVLAGIMTWADKYGERTVAMIQIYAEALGMCDIVRAEIAKLEEKIDALEAQLTYQIKVLNEKLNVELDKLNEQLSDLYAQLETAIGEQKAILEAKIAEIKALIAQVEMQIEQVKALIAEIQDNLANAQQQLAELSAKMQNLVSALLQLDDALKYLLDAGIEAATPVIQQALDGVANAVRDLVGVISTETAEQLDKMIHEAKDFLNRAFYDATHANYHIDAESSYVSLGDNKEVARLFAEYLKDYVAKEGVNFKYSTTDLSVENAKISDLAAILSENVSAIASADLISLNYSYDAIAEETLNILLDLLLEGNTAAMTDHNWAALAGESAATEIEAFLADLHATMVAQGFGVTLSEMIGFPVESNITIADAAILAVEHFAYSAVEYAVLMPQTVLSIQQINPDALIMVNAMSNPLAGAYITLLGEEFHFGDYIDYIVDATNVECTIFAAVTENVVFVPATKINTNCTGAAIIQVNSLNDVIDLMYAYKAGSLIQINPTAEGNAYAASKMAESLTITVEAADGLLGDANNDGIVNSIDSAMILQYDVNMIAADMIFLAVCDVNGDGSVNSIDAAMILQFDVGIIEQFPAAVH